MTRWLPWLALAAGCGPSSYQDFRAQLVANACARDRRCGLIGGSELDCPVPAMLPLFEAGPIDVDTAVSDGRMTYDPVNAQNCLDAVAGAPCDPAIAELHYLYYCHNVVGPGAANGTACRTEEECVGGRCVPPGDCPGLCVAYPAPGASCTPDGGLGAAGQPLDCDPTVEFCGDGTCQLHHQEGDPCAGPTECSFQLECGKGTCQRGSRTPDGHACAADHPCSDGSYCDTAGLCKPLGGDGAACVDDLGCAPGRGCRLVAVDGGAPALQCTRWSDVGRDCSLGPHSGCPATQQCQAGGGDAGASCVVVPRAAGPGQACAVSLDASTASSIATTCAPGLYCAGASCRFVIGLDGACDVSGPAVQCADGLHCDPTARRCVTAAICTSPDGGS